MAKEVKRRGKPKLAETIAIEKLWSNSPSSTSQEIADKYNQAHPGKPIDKAKAAQKKPKDLRRVSTRAGTSSGLDQIGEIESLYDSVGALQDALGNNFDDVLKEIESLMKVCGSISGIRKLAASRNRIRGTSSKSSKS